MSIAFLWKLDLLELEQQYTPYEPLSSCQSPHLPWGAFPLQRFSYHPQVILGSSL